MTNKTEEHLKRESYYVNFAQLTSMIMKDLSAREQQAIVKKYVKTDVKRFLDNPIRYTKELGDLSASLYNASQHYKRLVNYFANLPTLDYVIEPYGLDVEKVNEKSFRTGYQRANDLLDLINIKHEMGKAMAVAWIYDTFYGYEHVTKDSYFIQRLPNEFCQISSVEDGVFNFAFNFAYFERQEQKLEFFPPEFKKKYNKYRGGSEPQWQELDPSLTVCIKINEHLEYDLPPFIGVLASIFDIEDAKALKKTKETIDNYKFIFQKIPIREESDRNNDFLIDLNNVSMFHNKTARTLPDEIGLITTPFETGSIDFANVRSERNQVEDAERDFYSSAGTSQMLFNGNTTAQANLQKSIKVDEQEVFDVIRQIERWCNRKMKKEVKGSYRFRVHILDVTIFNKQEYIDNLLKSAQYGLPVKMMLCACLGLTPSAVSNMCYLENTILNLTSQFIPLSSSHTQTNDGGRPQENEDAIQEESQDQRDRRATEEAE